MKEFIFENAVVRIHPGKLSEEERRAVLEKACVEFYRAIQKSERRKNSEEGNVLPGLHSNADCGGLCTDRS